MQNEPMFQRLTSQKYDLALVDGLIYFKCLYLVPHRLQIPHLTHSFIFDSVLVKFPWLPSFMPHLITTYTEKMTFVERLINTAMAAAASTFTVTPDSPAEVINIIIRY